MYVHKPVNYLPQNLAYLRRQKKLKQHEIQPHLGFSRTTWSNYELGKAQPSVEGLIEISIFFGISLDQLIRSDLTANLPTGKKGVRYDIKDEQLSTVQEREEELSYVMKEVEKLWKEVNALKKAGNQ